MHIFYDLFSLYSVLCNLRFTGVRVVFFKKRAYFINICLGNVNADNYGSNGVGFFNSSTKKLARWVLNDELDDVCSLYEVVILEAN